MRTFPEGVEAEAALSPQQTVVHGDRVALVCLILFQSTSNLLLRHPFLKFPQFHLTRSD